MPTSTFTEKEAREIEVGLRHVIHDNGWWPTVDSFDLVGAAARLAALEAVPVKIIDGTPWAYLYRYGSKGDAGLQESLGLWVPMGGFPKPPVEDTAQFLVELGKKELGRPLIYAGVDLGTELWPPRGHPLAHPKGVPVSTYCLCQAEGLTDTQTHAWHSLSDLPEDMDLFHRDRLPKVWGKFRRGLALFSS